MLTGLAAAVDTADGPLDRLAALRALRDAVGQLEASTVDEARAGHASWSQVAASLGVSKQAAQRRFTPKSVREPSAEVEKAPAPPRKPVVWQVTTRGGRPLLRIVKDR